MRVAQRLYENGYITYMRTDSVNLSESAITAARQQVRDLFGDRFVPPQPRRYTGKVKNAQEAHEAIRPAGDAFRTPGDVAKELSGDEYRLYDAVGVAPFHGSLVSVVSVVENVHQRRTGAGLLGLVNRDIGVCSHYSPPT